MDIDTEEDEVIEDSIRGDLEAAFDKIEESESPVTEEKVDTKTRDESGKFAAATDKVTPPVDSVPEAPRSWTPAEKAEWVNMNPAQRAVVMRRETEIEQGFLKADEDRVFGKTLKDVVTPYMQMITAEGSTPSQAVQSLLNTAYVLRTASVAQKTALFHQLAQQYGVDLSQPNNNSIAQPNQILQQTQQQLADLQRQIQQQPEVFRQQQENLVIKSQIDAFAADPKNVHYERLKPVMASLLQGGQAKDLQDAYDKASWADPDIRSSNLAEQQKAAETKRIAEIKAKADLSRKASVSIRGTPSINPVANGKSNGSIADDLRDAWDAHA